MLIGICGKAGAGKDTIADHLWKHFAFTRIALADPMKRAAQEIFGLSDAQTWGREHKEVEIPYWGLSPRRMFQLLGTDATQPVFGRDIWLKRWRLSYGLVSHSDHVVVPDVRFSNEAIMIAELGGFILKVEREQPSTLAESAQIHPSEAGLPPYCLDAVIQNNFSIPDLHKEVLMFMQSKGFRP